MRINNLEKKMNLKEDSNAIEPRGSIDHKNTTEYPVVNQIMSSMMTELFKIVGKEGIVGINLTGSLAEGDFRPGKSDIDFIVVTKDYLPDEISNKIGEMHSHLSEEGIPVKLDGDYVPQSAIKKYDPQNSTYPHLGSDGHFAIEGHDIGDIISWSILRNSGVILYGQSPENFIDEIGPEELTNANYQTMKNWWEPMLLTDKLESDEEYQAFAILTMCRILYHFECGKMISKDAAAEWAKNEFPQFSNAIKLSQEWQKGNPLNLAPEAKEMISLALAVGSKKV